MAQDESAKRKRYTNRDFGPGIPVAIDEGGTGATTALQARINLGIVSGSGVWGEITGDIEEQTDLQNQFDTKQDQDDALDDIAALNLVEGDIFYVDSGGSVVRLGIGTEGQVLTVSSSGIPAWEDNTGGGGGPAPSLPSGVFGTGIDGDGTINSNVTITQDYEYNNLTVNATITIGWNVSEGRPARLKVANILHFGAVGRITCDAPTGAGAAGRPNGGLAAAGGTDGGSAGVANPENGFGSTAITAPSIGVKGSDGIAGNAAIATGGVAGSINYVSLTTLDELISGQVGGQDIMGGTGGGGGGRDSAANSGGGGGGGGFIHVLAKTITETSPYASARFSANSSVGVGNDFVNIGYGVGGPGGPGGIIVVCESIDTGIKFSATAPTAVVPAQTPPKGHVYLASIFSGSPYVYTIDGYYHPFELSA